MKEKLTSNYDDRQYMEAVDFELYYYHDSSMSKRTGLHTHPYYEFYFFLEGHAEAQVKKEHYMLTYGDILIVPPGISHGIFVHDFEIPYRRFDLWMSVPFFKSLTEISVDFAYAVNMASDEDRHVIHTDRITFNSVLSNLWFYSPLPIIYFGCERFSLKPAQIYGCFARKIAYTLNNSVLIKQYRSYGENRTVHYSDIANGNIIL